MAMPDRWADKQKNTKKPTIIGGGGAICPPPPPRGAATERDWEAERKVRTGVYQERSSERYEGVKPW